MNRIVIEIIWGISLLWFCEGIDGIVGVEFIFYWGGVDFDWYNWIIGMYLGWFDGVLCLILFIVVLWV